MVARAALLLLLAQTVAAKQMLFGQQQNVSRKPLLSRANGSVTHSFAAASSTHGARIASQPCSCVANDESWHATNRTKPKCIFIDLGAADGNTFEKFISDGYGPVANCPSGGEWEAYLVEANPQFDDQLKALEQKYPFKVHAMPSTAAYDCKASTSFFIDTDPTHNHWGSSMSEQAPDAVRSGKVKVTVPTINVNKLIATSVIPGDWVMLKVDIEGAEYEVVPCLANFMHANLVDRMYLEEHTWFPSGSQNGPVQMAAAKQQLQAKGVDIPGYFSNTF